jgi:hypothetical protein
MKKRRVIQPILWTERPTGAVMGGWFTLALPSSPGPSWTFLWLLILVIYLSWVPLLPSSSSWDPHLELLGELVPTISTSPPQVEASKKKPDAFSNCGNSKNYQPPHSFISVLPQITPRWCLIAKKPAAHLHNECSLTASLSKTLANHPFWF